MHFRSKRRSSLRWIPLTVLVALLAGVTMLGDRGVAQGGVQDDSGVREKEPFAQTTDDGVELVGDFYPSNKGKNAPCVVLLHDVSRPNAKRQDWEKFPEKLQKAGFAVLAFDFRGFGESTRIDPTLSWFRTVGRTYPRGFNPNRPPARISAKDWRYWQDLLWLGNDLIAVKKWLAAKNNAMECNSTNICLIGAEGGALIGFFWVVVENTDPNRLKTPSKYEGEDISCCIWLSMRPVLRPPAGSARKNVERVLEFWMKEGHAPVLQKRYPSYSHVPTFAIFGANDRGSLFFWRKAIRWIKPADANVDLEDTGILRVKNTKLSGTKLVTTEGLGVDEEIVRYLKEYMPKGKPWQKQREPEFAQPVLFDMRRTLIR